MNISMKQKQTLRHREQIHGCQCIGGGDGLGVWNEQMQTSTYRADKKQGPTGYHRELYLISFDEPQWKILECIYIYMYIYIYV